MNRSEVRRDPSNLNNHRPGSIISRGFERLIIAGKPWLAGRVLCFVGNNFRIAVKWKTRFLVMILGLMTDCLVNRGWIDK